MTMIIETHVAAKEHRCAGGCAAAILPGQQYVDEVAPPWTLVIDDPDDHRGAPLGEWAHTRFHNVCFDERMYGGW